MAPFNCHLLVAEKIWPSVRAMAGLSVTDNKIYYGQFCFGCVATDVDKVAATLTQKDTHFFDRTGDYDLMATHRSAAFLEQQANFFSYPFSQLPTAAQAFVLGYLCHLCVDEVSKLMWRRDTWLQFKQVTPGSAFAALDEAAWQRIRNYQAIAEALCSIEVLDIIPRIPLADLERMHRGTCTFVRAQTIEEEYLALVDLFDRPSPEQRQEKQQRFRTEIDHARRQTHIFRMDTLIEAGLIRSRQRLTDLIEGRMPAPGLPVLEE